VGSITFW